MRRVQRYDLRSPVDGRLARAVLAAAEDREVLHVGLEAEASPGASSVNSAATATSASMTFVAVPADQVDVVVPVGEVVRRARRGRDGRG